MLKVQGVNKVYGQGESRVNALYDVSFEVLHGEFVLIVGSSGSGKTTLLNMIGLLNTPSSGRVIIDGVNTTGLDSSKTAQFRNRKLGFVAQFSNMMVDLTVLENVMLPRQIAGGRMALNARADAMALLRAVGLEAQADRRANRISGGQAQRAAIARGLVNKPSIVLADEPTGNLDSTTSENVIRLMKSTARRLRQTFVVVTHDREHFGDVDRVITVSDGRVSESVCENPLEARR